MWGNFAEVTEKAVENFADHLKCNAVCGLVDPKLHVNFANRASDATHCAGATHLPHSTPKSSAGNFPGHPTGAL